MGQVHFEDLYVNPPSNCAHFHNNIVCKIFLAPRPAMFRLYLCISSVFTEPWLGVEFQRTMQ